MKGGIVHVVHCNEIHSCIVMELVHSFERAEVEGASLVCNLVATDGAGMTIYVYYVYVSCNVCIESWSR